MKDGGTFTFKDSETGEDVCIIVRVTGDGVGLCLSLKAGGDVEVNMTRSTASLVAEAIAAVATG